MLFLNCICIFTYNSCFPFIVVLELHLYIYLLETYTSSFPYSSLRKHRLSPPVEELFNPIALASEARPNFRVVLEINNNASTWQTADSLTVPIILFDMPSGQRYCCVCKNHGQKYIGDKKVSMHRFPANKRVRRVWIQRCRNARPNFVFKNYDQTRLCSVHFNDGNGPKPNHNLPTIFPTKSGEQKIYQISVSNTPPPPPGGYSHFFCIRRLGPSIYRSPK